MTGCPSEEIEFRVTVSVDPFVGERSPRKVRLCGELVIGVDGALWLPERSVRFFEISEAAMRIPSGDQWESVLQ
jgi:hypothetical protein